MADALALPTISATDRARADDSVSARFTRVMNATTSRWGVLTDPPMVGVATAPLAIAALASARLDASSGVVSSLTLLATVPVIVAVAASLMLRGAREKVVSWIASRPFPVENMNAILNGLGDELEVTFVATLPETAEVNRALDAVSADCFVSKPPDERGDGRVIDIRVGVVDSKRNPSASNHLRFLRVHDIVDAVLVPLAGAHRIAEVRVK